MHEFVSPFTLPRLFGRPQRQRLQQLQYLLLSDKVWALQPNIDALKAAMIPLIVGIVINTLIGICAIFAAVYYKIRIWVHPLLRNMLHEDLNTIALLRFPCYGFNHAIFVIATALVSPLAVLGTICMMILTVGKNVQECSSISGIIFGFFVIFGGPLAMIPCYAWLSSRIIARNPQDAGRTTLCENSKKSPRDATGGLGYGALLKLALTLTLSQWERGLSQGTIKSQVFLLRSRMGRPRFSLRHRRWSRDGF